MQTGAFYEQSSQVVIGLGNLLNRDEGFGVHAVRALQERTRPAPGIQIIDGGVLGLDLLPVVESCRRLLVLDAVDMGLPPGTVVELEDEQVPAYAGIKLSQHQCGFQEVLGLAMFRSRLPEQLCLLGVQPADLSFGVGLTPVVDAALARILQRAGQIILSWDS